MSAPLPQVSLRPWTTADEAHLSEWFTHAEVPEYLVPRPSGINLQRGDRHAWVFLDDGAQMFAVCAGANPEAPAPIGLGALHSASGGAQELGLVIGDESVWGQGYGRAATVALAAQAFADPACNQLVARVQPDNARALACYRSVGFESRAGRADEPVWLFLTRTAWRAQVLLRSTSAEI